jgi:hypothetical protein
MSDLQKEIETLLNQRGADTMTGTPDYILAKFLKGCLDAFAKAIHERDHHQGLTLNELNEMGRKEMFPC